MLTWITSQNGAIDLRMMGEENSLPTGDSYYWVILAHYLGDITLTKRL